MVLVAGEETEGIEADGVASATGGGAGGGITCR
jgi:hypothetical protein